MEIRKEKIRDGYMFSYFDISQAEPRTICYQSDDPLFKELYEVGGDAYRELAMRRWLVSHGYSPDMDSPGRKEIDMKWVKQQRSIYKGIILSGIYGQSIASLAKRAGVSKEVGMEIWNGFMDPMVKVREFRDSAIEYATNTGYIKTILGERIKCNMSRIYTTANNARVQGFAAILLACFFFNAVERAMHEGIDCSVKTVIHDSVNYEFPINRLFHMDLMCRKHFRQACRKYFKCDYKFDWDLLLDMMHHIPYSFNIDTGIAKFDMWSERADYFLDHLSTSYKFKVNSREFYDERDEEGIKGIDDILTTFCPRVDHQILTSEAFRQYKKVKIEIQLTEPLKDIEFWTTPLPETFEEYTKEFNWVGV